MAMIFVLSFVFFFFKQKTAYEMRISDRSSDVCSSDLVIWTIVPIIILIVMVWPATEKLIAQYDTRDSELTVKVTGYQWMWKYEILGEGVELPSRLPLDINAMRQSGQQPTLESQPN